MRKIILLWLLAPFLTAASDEVWIDSLDIVAYLEDGNVSALAHAYVFGEPGDIVPLPILHKNTTYIFVEDEEGNEMNYAVEDGVLFLQIGEDTKDVHEFYLYQQAEDAGKGTIDDFGLSIIFPVYTTIASVSLCIPANYSLLDFANGGEVSIDGDSLCISYMFSDIYANQTKNVWVRYKSRAPSPHISLPISQSTSPPAPKPTPQINQEKTTTIIILVVAAFLLLIILLLLLFFIKKKKRGENDEHVKPEGKEETGSAHLLPEKERKVYEALVREGGSCTGVKLKALTGLSGPSLTRAVRYLAQRDIVAVERYGMTNLIVLKEKEGGGGKSGVEKAN
ncbi:MAG: hypothetical protein QXP42_02805 [Candidatus Micrarchaeia archaeon]